MGWSNPSRETKFSGANGDREIVIFFPVQLTTSRIGNLTRLIHTLLHVMTIHTYILYAAVDSSHVTVVQPIAHGDIINTRHDMFPPKAPLTRPLVYRLEDLQYTITKSSKCPHDITLPKATAENP